MGASLACAIQPGENIFEILDRLSQILRQPFSLHYTVYTGKCILILSFAYITGICIYYSQQKNYRRGVEHGSARWGDVHQICKRYADKEYTHNLLLTQNFRMSQEVYKHQRNLNVLVAGGSGAGKSRTYAVPNILQCSQAESKKGGGCSIVVTDPKGELLRKTGGLLERMGYEVRVFDLINPDTSFCYNPFCYVHDDKDVLKLINNLIRNTTPKGSQASDPFWEKSETALLQALMLYLLHEAPPEEQNFPMIMEMLGSAQVKEEDEEYQSPLDILFERLEMRKPDSIAVKQYQIYKQAAGVARENIAEVKNATPLRDSANRIKQAHTAKTSKEASKLKKQAEHAYRSGKKLAVQGKKAATQSAKAAKRTVSGIKTAVKTGVTAVKSLGTFLVAGGWIVVLLVIVLGVIGGIAGSSGSTSAEPLSQEVLAYTSTIQRYASQYGISEYVPSIQAIMMQESGGRGTDPMQASECPYNTRYPNSPGAIQDPEYSIQVGVQYYADCVRQAGCESPLDISRLQLSWQGYNYGNGYIGWALEHHGGYSLENALQFSQEKAAELGWPRYGDPQYVPHVQRYYSGGGILGGIFGNGQIVQVAKQEVGSSNGEKYWRWYGFDSYVEWCACFVSWCGEQAGLIESGAMPKFSLCENGIDWFKSHGKWQETGGIPSAGSLVFFDWNGDGISDHVGIVEKYEGGIIYTVEGNTGTNIGGNNVRGVWKHSYSVGSATILGYGII